MTYNVLSLDGGGIRGIISVVLLERLAQEPGLSGYLDRVQFVAGTSTGGLIALGLAAGMSFAELRGLYVEDGPRIFADTALDDIKDLGKLIGADYATAPREAALKRIFGQKTLGELRKRVLITAFDLDNLEPDPRARRWKPKLFHNFPGDDADSSALAYKVGLYTSAAPTYFPTVDGFVDGGVFAPNPSLCALTQTQDMRIKEPIPFGEVRLLSIGTGESLLRVEGDQDWGLAQWAKPLVDLLLEGVSGIAHYQCLQLLRDRYHRLGPVFPPEVSFALDDVRRIPQMIEFARTVDVTQAAAFIRANFV
jgi:uncharacterized protein